MKAVLISIRPKWCEKIVNGKKTIEVRKTRPKLETPFKCYIYCTQGDDRLWLRDAAWRESWKNAPISFLCNAESCGGMSLGNGSVVGEFVCDEIKYFDFEESEWAYSVAPPGSDMPMHESEALKLCYKDGCLNDDDMLSYFGDEAWKAYFWHISDLKIYDKPRELGDFWLYNEELHKRYDAGTDYCCYDGANEYGEALTDCGDAYLNIRNCLRCWNEWSGWCHHLKRAPQSWCYVEEEI